MNGLVVWFTGLPSSGKTSLAEAVRQRLDAQGVRCCRLDSDEVREALRPRLGYAERERDGFYETLGRLAAMLARQGLVVLTSATAPARRHREAARAAAPAFLEVFVETPVAECERRDAKGLYARAREGEIADFPGVSADYEAPNAPDVVAPGGLDDANLAAVAYAVTQRLEGR